MAQKSKVYSNDNVAIVSSLQNYLLQHDIQAEIRNQYTSSVMGEVAFFDAWPELWVNQSDVIEAKQLLDDVTATQSQQPTGSDWLCLQCRETNPANFELCWQCNNPQS